MGKDQEEEVKGGKGRENIRVDGEKLSRRKRRVHAWREGRRSASRRGRES